MSAGTMAPLMTLAQVAEWSDGTLESVPALGGSGASPAGIAIEGVSIDTRTLAPGDLFVPLPGSHADGHQFLGEAFRRGAAAALCGRPHRARLASPAPGPLVVVSDVTLALHRLALRHRLGWDGALIAVTGSSGKTTTKDLIALALGADRPTLATRGNLNNQWGVPLTLLGLRPEHRAAVIELGANHDGEIAALAALARPTLGVITQVGSAHLEHFGSLEAIAKEKAALAMALPAGAALFASADSPALLKALAPARSRVVTFGLSPHADLRPDRLLDLGPQGTRIEVEGFPPFTLALIGAHQVPNALAALLVARELGCDPAATVRALEGYRAPSRRMELRHIRGAEVVVDCYNANPESTRGALEALAGWNREARRIAVLGDMLELGQASEALHRAVGAAARGVELWVVGAFASAYDAGARSSGSTARVFPDKQAVALELGRVLAPGVVVLLKASRGAALEEVLQGLEAEG